MCSKVKILVLFASVALIICVLPNTVPAAGRSQASIVAAEISTIANMLSLHPEGALDLSAVSGEYCFNAKLGEGGLMIHFAIDPQNTEEDVVSFYNAKPLIAAGLDGTKLQRPPNKLGDMIPNTWYFLPAGEFEPHHGVRFPFPIIIKAMDLVGPVK